MNAELEFDASNPTHRIEREIAFADPLVDKHVDANGYRWLWKALVGGKRGFWWTDDRLKLVDSPVGEIPALEAGTPEDAADVAQAKAVLARIESGEERLVSVPPDWGSYPINQRQIPALETVVSSYFTAFEPIKQGGGYSVPFRIATPEERDAILAAEAEGMARSAAEKRARGEDPLAWAIDHLPGYQQAHAEAARAEQAKMGAAIKPAALDIGPYAMPLQGDPEGTPLYAIVAESGAVVGWSKTPNFEGQRAGAVLESSGEYRVFGVEPVRDGHPKMPEGFQEIASMVEAEGANLGVNGPYAIPADELETEVHRLQCETRRLNDIISNLSRRNDELEERIARVVEFALLDPFARMGSERVPVHPDVMRQALMENVQSKPTVTGGDPAEPRED